MYVDILQLGQGVVSDSSSLPKRSCGYTLSSPTPMRILCEWITGSMEGTLGPWKPPLNPIHYFLNNSESVPTVQATYDQLKSQRIGMAAKLRKNCWLRLVAGPMTEDLGSAWLTHAAIYLIRGHKMKKFMFMPILNRKKKQTNKEPIVTFFFIPSPLQKHYFLKMSSGSLQNGRYSHLVKSIPIKCQCLLYWRGKCKRTIKH